MKLTLSFNSDSFCFMLANHGSSSYYYPPPNEFVRDSGIRSILSCVSPSFRGLKHLFLTSLACVQTNFGKLKFKMAGLSPLLAAHIDQYLKNQICPGGSAHIFNFVQIRLFPHVFSQVSEHSNYLLKLQKYLLILSVLINISNTNEFAILYTCINYNPAMNPVKFRHNQIQDGRLIVILFA